MSETDVKNSKRNNAPLVEVQLSYTDDAVKFLRVALEIFLGFELFRMFEPDELEKVRRALML